MNSTPNTQPNVINCAQCGTEVSALAKVCPNCGYKGKTQSENFNTLLQGVAITTFIGAAIGIYFLLLALESDGYPGMAAYAAVAATFVVIPYCVLRTLFMHQQNSQMKQVIQMLKNK